MKSIAAKAVIGLLLFVGSVSASEVTKVEIGYQDGATVARIAVEGPIRFTHETEVPKNGRPNRVIVDILSATHELGAKEFLSLPTGLITGLRTSQFAVNPERIVRVVFDLTSAPVYRVDSKAGMIVVIFENKGVKQFKTWSSRKVVALTRQSARPSLAVKPVRAKVSSTTKQNQAVEADRLASLGGKAKAEPAKAVQRPKVSPKSIKTSDRRFSARTYSDKPPVAKAPTPVVKKSAPVAKAPAPVAKKSAPVAKAPTPVVKKSAPVAKALAPVAKKSAPVAKAPVPVVKKSAPVAKAPTPVVKKSAPIAKAPTPTVKKTDTAIAPPKPPAGNSAKVAKVSKPKVAQGQKALAQKVAGQNPTASAGKLAEPKPRATARFRRKAPSAKIRGTMVAEFPKRLVIKYKSSGRRDPFGSLIDADRTYDNPVEIRIPNVEGLRLVGVLSSDGDSNRALFEDKAGLSYILKGGDKVRNGYVLRVDEDQVYFQIFEYGWSRTVALTME
jgi:hypothetical protein